MTDFQVKCFLTVAEKLNFTEAAQIMFVSQSNISRQISVLEEELGLTLFQRSTKAVKLTPAGQILYEKLQEMTEEWNDVLAQARNLSSEDGNLSIGCVPWDMSNSMLSSLLFDFQQEYPNIKIHKERGRQSTLINGLKSGYFDAILIANHDVCCLTNITELTLYYNPLCIILHSNHPLYTAPEVKLSDLTDSKFLSYMPVSIPKEKNYLYQTCKGYGFEPSLVAEYEDFEEFLYSIETGKGAAVLCEETAYPTNSNLRIIRIEGGPDRCMDMKLASKSNNPKKELKNLFDFIQNKWKSWPLRNLV